MDDAEIKRKVELIQFSGPPQTAMVDLAKELFPDCIIRPAILITFRDGRVISVEAVER